MNLSLLPKNLRVYFTQLSEVISYAEKSWYFSTSQFFSKVGAYEALLKFNKGNRLTFTLIVIQICKYILRVSAFFYLYIFFKLVHSLSGQKSNRSSSEIVYIDSYLVVNYVISGNGLVDNYFTGLLDILKKNQREYTIIPRLYDAWNPISLYRFFLKIKENRDNVLTDFELFSFVDFFKLVIYLIVYPFKMFFFYRSKINALADNEFLRYYFWLDMNGSNFFGGVRYLFAQKFKSRLNGRDKILQWYENQPYEKTLNRVMRESNMKNEIYGCQLYLYPVENFNAYIDPNEIQKHLPHQILVNGSYYLDSNNKISKIGPSLRYSNLFKTPIYTNSTGNRLVLMSYFESSNKHIIRILNTLQTKETFTLKFHPSNDIDEYKGKIRLNFEVATDDLYNLFKSTELVIGAASGTLVEAIACGIPALVITEDGVVDYSYLPEFCKGILWDIVWDEESLRICSVKLNQHVLEDSIERKEMIGRVRDEMFSIPNEEKIVSIFGI
ncbi:MAG: hypothetical protein O9264_13295 [Leptospira sp.]|nr:hypothetical protein [Leptospira sp.]